MWPQSVEPIVDILKISNEPHLRNVRKFVHKVVSSLRQVGLIQIPMSGVSAEEPALSRQGGKYAGD